MSVYTRKARTTINAGTVSVMVALRRKGFTLQFIAEIVGVSIGCVYQNTKHIPCMSRHYGFVVVDRQTGKFISQGR